MTGKYKHTFILITILCVYSILFSDAGNLCFAYFSDDIPSDEHYILRKASQRDITIMEFNNLYELMLNPVNINTASRKDLLAIPGITKEQAEGIFDYRESFGFFKSIVIKSGLQISALTESCSR